MPIKTKNPKKIMEKVMGEYKKNELNIGKSKKKVKKRSQAIAIGLDIARRKGNKIKKKGKKWQLLRSQTQNQILNRNQQISKADMSELVVKILNFIVECLKTFINIFSFGKLFKKSEESKDGLQK